MTAEPGWTPDELDALRDLLPDPEGASVADALDRLETLPPEALARAVVSLLSNAPFCLGCGADLSLCPCPTPSPSRAGNLPVAETTHLCPPTGQFYAPCCGLTPFELPRTDRVTEDSALVTCRGSA